MNGKAIACLVVLAPLVLVGCAAGSGGTGGSPVSERNEVTATGAEQSLLAALNARRRAAGKAELAVSPVLARLSRGESDAAAASAQLPAMNVEALKARSGFGSVAKMQGVLKDRGTATGKAFVDYWAKGSSEMILDDWSKVGVGVSKAADGRLFAVVIFGGSGGGGFSLMKPGMSPSGF